MMFARLFAVGLCMSLWVPAAQARDLIVFAAASLKGPLDEIAAEHGGVRVSYAGSGTLARQVAQGAPADVVLLANTAWMDVLVSDGAVQDPVIVLGNRRVHPDAAAFLEALRAPVAQAVFAAAGFCGLPATCAAP